MRLKFFNSSIKLALYIFCVLLFSQAVVYSQPGKPPAPPPPKPNGFGNNGSNQGAGSGSNGAGASGSGSSGFRLLKININPIFSLGMTRAEYNSNPRDSALIIKTKIRQYRFERNPMFFSNRLTQLMLFQESGNIVNETPDDLYNYYFKFGSPEENTITDTVKTLKQFKGIPDGAYAVKTIQAVWLLRYHKIKFSATIIQLKPNSWWVKHSITYTGLPEYNRMLTDIEERIN